jgi:HEPN domain-containing protein
MERFEESKRWFKQALRDFEAAKASLNMGFYEWSCFQAQQATEKAVKALLYAYGRSGWGHSIVELLDALRALIEVPEEIYVYARELDRHYIPSRYPNAFESGYPAMYYDRAVAERAVNSAEKVIEWVRERLAKLGLIL